MKISEATFKETIEIVVDHSILNQPRIKMYASEERLVKTINCRSYPAAYKMCGQLTGHWLKILKENE